MVMAHTDAYNKTQILHRDVSAGNILITEEGKGILIDWDLSKKVKDDADAKPRRHSRTVGVSILSCTQ
jgi:RIO-like serine/threonine protein kinase